MITGTRIDVVPWLTRVTLDIIGLTGELALPINAHHSFVNRIQLRL